MIDNRKTLAIVTAVLILGCVGAFAYSRRSADSAANPLPQPSFGQSAPQREYGNSNPSHQVREDGYYSSIRRPIYVHNAMQNQPQAPIRDTNEASERGATEVHRNTYAVEPRYREEVRHRRSTGKSAAIVVGSAGVGAAIGALAGGGKGAGIGALSGGGAGFVYDRMTHNHVH